MTHKNKKSVSRHRITRLFIWSVRHQSWLAGQVRIYILMTTAIIAFLALAGVISLNTAMFASFCFGGITMGIIWTLVQQRKWWLLNIRDPEQRQQALAAMRAYIHEVNGQGKAGRRSYGMEKENSEHCVDCRMS